MATVIPKNEATFSLAEVLLATGGRSIGAAPLGNACGVCSDTRRLRAGELFVALRGIRYDAHEHLEAAHRGGAKLLVVDREECLPLGAAGVLVPSTLAALGALARFHRRRWKLADARRRVVAITGSAGKTTTKQAVAGVLSAVTGEGVHRPAGNLNNQVGVPLTLLGLTEQHRYAVVELGTNAPGEIATLAAMCEPDVAVVTLIALAHTAGLGSLDDVAAEKTALFARLSETGGVAVGNLDDRRVARALSKITGPVVGYGHRAGALAAVVIAASRLREQLDTELLLIDPCDKHFSVTTPLLGTAGALASAAALAVVVALGLVVADEALLTQGLSEGSPPGRLQVRHAADGWLIIDDSYNANPASMRSSIRFAAEVASLGGRRLVLVLGEMRELGALSGRLHREIGSVAVEAPAALVIGVGGNARQLVDSAAEAGVKAYFATDADDAVRLARRYLTAADVVLVKGSRGVRTERVIEQLLRPRRHRRGEGAEQRCGRGST